jgi:hypothetical protein
MGGADRGDRGDRGATGGNRGGGSAKMNSNRGDRGNRVERQRPNGGRVVTGGGDRGGRGMESRNRDRGGRGDYRRGRRLSWGDGIYFYFWDGYYYGDCAWLHRRAIATGSRVWWSRYRQCRAGY